MRSVQRLAFACAAITAFIAPQTSAAYAQAGAISQADIAFFQQESYRGSNKSDAEKDWEDYLFEAIEVGKTPEQAIALFSAKIQADETSAETIASAIIEIVRWDEFCPDRQNKNDYDCRFEPGAPAYDKFILAQSVDTTGELAFIIGKNVGSEWDPIEIRKPFLDNVVQHPGRILTFTRLLDYNRDDLWIFALAAAGEIDSDTAKLIFLRHYSGSMYDASSWNGASMALIEGLLETHSIDQDSRSLLSLALITLQIRAGMNETARGTYRRLPQAIRSYVPSPDAPDAKYDVDRLFENYISFKIDLASAFVEQGNQHYAQNLLEEAARQSDNFANIRYSFRTRARALNEIITPKLEKNSVFDYFLYGRLPDEPDPAETEQYIIDGPGWLFQIGSAAPAFREIAAAYLQERGYEGMAKHLANQPLYQRSDKADALIDSLLPLLPEKFTARKEYWSEQINLIWNQHSRKSESTPDENADENAFKGMRNVTHFLELELPEPFRTMPTEAGFEERFDPTLAEGIELPVSEYQVIRYVKENGERQIIFLSSALDAPGEVPAYGYWFQQTTGGGKIWDEPLYLGLQQYFPYVIVAHSKLPIITGGTLNIEVEAREIDPRSISFPPVGLTLKRQERNLYLSFNIETLRKDTDGDGLTDLVERRLQMNPSSADSDNDGLDDARDPLPLTTFDPDAPVMDKELAYAILSAIVGYERQAIIVTPGSVGEQFDLMDMIGADRPPSISDGAVFLVAAPEKFAGIRTPFRLFVFNEENVKNLNADGAPFYPAGVTSMFKRPDGSEYYIIWSASWTGGEFVIRCNNGKCETEVVSEWIS